jgi:hypothetical protein
MDSTLSELLKWFEGSTRHRIMLDGRLDTRPDNSESYHRDDNMSEYTLDTIHRSTQGADRTITIYRIIDKR